MVTKYLKQLTRKSILQITVTKQILTTLVGEESFHRLMPYASGIPHAWLITPWLIPNYWAGVVPHKGVSLKDIHPADLPLFGMGTLPLRATPTSSSNPIQSAPTTQSDDSIYKLDNVYQDATAKAANSNQRPERCQPSTRPRALGQTRNKKRLTADQSIVAEGRNGVRLGKTRAATRSDQRPEWRRSNRPEAGSQKRNKKRVTADQRIVAQGRDGMRLGRTRAATRKGLIIEWL